MTDRQERKKWLSMKSLRFRIIFLVVMAMAIMLLLMVFNNIYAINVVRNQVFATNSRMLALYMSQIDNAFDDVENYWIGLQNSPELFTIQWRQNETDYYTAQARLKQEIESAVPSYGYIEDIFIYFKEHDAYMDAAKYDLDGSERREIQKAVQERVNGEIADEERGKWVGMEIRGEYYLLRILRIRQVYVGGCVKVSTLVSRLREEGFGEKDYLTFCTNDGLELGNSLPQFEEPLLITGSQEHYRLVGENTKYMLMSAPASNGDYSLVTMVRDNNILEGLGSVQKLILGLCVCIVVFLILFTISVKRWMLEPLGDLVTAMQSLSKGDMEVRLQKHADCEEISIVNRTFDNMIEEIRDLKIDVYEEKMQRQKAELQYLKLQINPHFYINCLNIIHNLSIMNRNELVQEMTTYLGNHLRYTMEGNSVGSLGKEIDYVKNYLRIQELRFADSFRVSFDIEENLLSIPVPPLIIQTFVENTVKYQVVAGELTQMFIQVKRLKGEDHKIQIEIWDTGDGFSAPVLECLENDERYYDERGEHFGIYNVKQRLKLIYQERVQMIFQNHPETGGAYVTLIMPDDGGEGGTENDTGIDCG